MENEGLRLFEAHQVLWVKNFPGAGNQPPPAPPQDLQGGEDAQSLQEPRMLASEPPPPSIFHTQELEPSLK